MILGRAFAVAVCLLGAPSVALATQNVPQVLTDISVGDPRGVTLSPELVFTDGAGEEKRLSDWTERDRPVLLTLNYMGCPMLCGLQQSGLAASIEASGLTAGVDFHMLTVSINPDETAEMAEKATERLSGVVGGAWDMVIAEPDVLATLTEALQFGYTKDPVSGEYAHPAAIFVLSPGGQVSQVLGGLQPEGRDLRLATVDASAGRVGNALDVLLLSCMQYDPEAQSYAPTGRRIMRAGGVVVLSGLTIFLGVMWRRERNGCEEESNV